MNIRVVSLLFSKITCSAVLLGALFFFSTDGKAQDLALNSMYPILATSSKVATEQSKLAHEICVNNGFDQGALEFRLGTHEFNSPFAKVFGLIKTGFTFASIHTFLNANEEAQNPAYGDFPRSFHIFTQLECISKAVSRVELLTELPPRPEATQKQIESEHLALLKAGDSWGITGNKLYPQALLSKDRLIDWVIAKAGAQPEIHILDFGAGTFAWLEDLADILVRNYQHSGKKFYLHGVVGESQTGRIKILTREFYKKHGQDLVVFDLRDEVRIEDIDQLYPANFFNLIVSSWTIRHLVDPLGTLSRLYNLLAPQIGIISSDFVYSPNYNPWYNLLFSSNGVFLTTEPSSGHGGLQILGFRPDSLPFMSNCVYSGQTAIRFSEAGNKSCYYSDHPCRAGYSSKAQDLTHQQVTARVHYIEEENWIKKPYKGDELFFLEFRNLRIEELRLIELELQSCLDPIE